MKSRIEQLLSEILSDKYDAKITIKFEKEEESCANYVEATPAIQDAQTQNQKQFTIAMSVAEKSMKVMIITTFTKNVGAVNVLKAV